MNTVTHSFLVPGTESLLHFERAESGQLMRLTGSERVYLEQCEHERVLGDGFATISEVVIGNKMLRQVHTADDFWVEEYHWDENGRLAYVDGVQVERDASNRVTACITPEGRWQYGYSEDYLVRITTPFEERRLRRGSDGRITRIRHQGGRYEVGYDVNGNRCDLPALPENYHRDTLGRLWTITDEAGNAIVTYLWDGYACIGRIDGALGDPLSVVFSLDPTCTPVRMVTHEGVFCLPRDAYGERLLTVEGIPGLYGGTLYDGFCYYAARALDPFSAAFHAPDPLHGLENDPRRAEGYHGPLMVEHPAAGPYAVCQHDPISRADPTGEFSFWILLSDLTWSLQNNIIGWLGMDFMFNFWGSLFTGNIGRFFDRTALYSERVGTWGVRSDGLVGTFQDGRAWTLQHHVWDKREAFATLTEARAFVPGSAFRPTHYGTLLRAEPKNNTAFLLTSDATITEGTPVTWTRGGGTAEAVVPGSLVPHFPSGGLHFDGAPLKFAADPKQKIYCPQDCTVTEIESSGGLASGSSSLRIRIDVPTTGLGLKGDALLLLSNSTPNIFILVVATAIEESGHTRVYLKTDMPSLGPNNVRLRGLSAAISTENINHDAATPTAYLNAVGTTGAYGRGDPLRLNQGGGPVGAALIDHFEARLQIDAPLTGLNTPINVSTAQALGASSPAKLAADAQTLDSTSGPPNLHDVLVISKTDNSASLAVVVTQVTGNQWQVDRAVQPLLGGSGGDVNWRRLTAALAPLGVKSDALEAGSVITYQADVPRTAPTANFVQFRDRDGKLAARAVTGLTYDAIVLGTPLPGTPANPYSIERFLPQPPDQNNLTVIHANQVVLNPPLGNDAVALQFYQFTGASMTTGGTMGFTPTGGASAPIDFVLNVAGDTATFAIPTPPGGTFGSLSSFHLSGICGIQPTGGSVVPALLKKFRLGVTLDRTLPLGAGKLEVVPLAATGPIYNAIARAVPPGNSAAGILTVKPEMQISAVGEPIQMPHFQVGELVQVKWTSHGGGSRLYRINAVEGTTLTLEHDANLLTSDAPPVLPPDPTVQRMEPSAPIPATGGSRIAVNGAAGAAGGTNQATFDVWAADKFPLKSPIGIVDPGASVTFPAQADHLNSFEIGFATLNPISGGTARILATTPTSKTAAAAFVRDSGAITVTTAPALTANDFTLAVVYKNSAVSNKGSLSAGTVIVPNDPGDGELTREDSLITHELTHTRQSATWGPLLLFGFPTFILEGIVEATTEVEMPEYSAYVAGTIASENGSRFLQIPNPQGITFSSGDHVQITWSAQQGSVSASGAGVPQSLTLGTSQVANKFLINAGANLIPIEVANIQVRRERNSTAWGTILDIAQLLSPGGIMNLAGGFLWGGLFTLVGRGIYALGRLIGGHGKNYPATVEGTGNDDKKLLRLGDDAGRAALGGASRIIVQINDSTVVRDVADITAGVIRVTTAVTFTGTVRVAPYDTHTPDSYWDWNNYFPATIPDASRPASIKLQAVGSDTLTLKVFDRVATRVGSSSYHRTVTAVAADGTVELNEAVPMSGEPILQVAKIGEEDPMGNLDDKALIDLYGMDWMRWAFDPYSQLQYRLRPDPSSFWGILARTARYAFSSSSWSFIVACVAILDHTGSYTSHLEQDASGESGDTYTPLGRLRDDVKVVGDIAHYWWLPTGGYRDSDNMFLPSMGDSPGVQSAYNFGTRVTNILRVVPEVTAGKRRINDKDVTDITLGTSNGTDPGRDVPDIFFSKTTSADNNPLTVKALKPANPGGFAPANRGWIPTSSTLERAVGMYVAFTRPGNHRITVASDDDSATGSFSGEVNNGNEMGESGLQPLWFDRNVTDVTVTINGQTINENSTFTLVQKQRVTVSVLPNAARRYTATLLQPNMGNVLRAPDPNNPLVIEAQTNVDSERVEISRFYRFDTASGKYDDPVLQKHGVHLPTDIHIPVRSFNIQVSDTLPVHNALSLDPLTVIAELHPNQEAFILVPVPIGPQGLQIGVATGPGGATLSQADRDTLRNNLVQTTPLPPLPDDVKAFIGDGGVIHLSFVPAIVLAGQTALQITIEVGAAAPRLQLKVALNLLP